MPLCLWCSEVEAKNRVDDTSDTGVSEKKLHCPITSAFVCSVGNRTQDLACVRQVLCHGASVPDVEFSILLCLLSGFGIIGVLDYTQGYCLSGSSL